MQELTTFAVSTDGSKIWIVNENGDFIDEHNVQEFTAEVSFILIKTVEILVDQKQNLAFTGLDKCRKLVNAFTEITEGIIACVSGENVQNVQNFTINYSMATINECKNYVEEYII